MSEGIERQSSFARDFYVSSGVNPSNVLPQVDNSPEGEVNPPPYPGSGPSGGSSNPQEHDKGHVAMNPLPRMTEADRLRWEREDKRRRKEDLGCFAIIGALCCLCCFFG